MKKEALKFPHDLEEKSVVFYKADASHFKNDQEILQQMGKKGFGNPWVMAEVIRVERDEKKQVTSVEIEHGIHQIRETLTGEGLKRIRSFHSNL